MLTRKTIGFLGAGNMAEALIRGLLHSKKVSPGQIIASDRFKDRLVHMAGTYDIKVFNKNYEVAGASDIVFIAVKPNDVPALLEEVAPELKETKLLITVAAGVTTDRILSFLQKDLPVVRAMPNTPATVGEGVTAIVAGPGAGPRELGLARSIFEAVGAVVELKDEELMDAVTGLSGSGPAYIFMVMDALVRAGVELGLSAECARVLALRTTLGAARLALESKRPLKELIDMVTSPGGTTIEGLKKLRAADVEGAFVEAVRAAAERSRELSGRK